MWCGRTRAAQRWKIRFLRAGVSMVYRIFAMDDTLVRWRDIWRVFFPPRQWSTSAAPREVTTERAWMLTTAEISHNWETSYEQTPKWHDLFRKYPGLTDSKKTTRSFHWVEPLRNTIKLWDQRSVQRIVASERLHILLSYPLLHGSKQTCQLMTSTWKISYALMER